MEKYDILDFDYIHNVQELNLKVGTDLNTLRTICELEKYLSVLDWPSYCDDF